MSFDYIPRYVPPIIEKKLSHFTHPNEQTVYLFFSDNKNFHPVIKLPQYIIDEFKNIIQAQSCLEETKYFIELPPSDSNLNFKKYLTDTHFLHLIKNILIFSYPWEKIPRDWIVPICEFFLAINLNDHVNTITTVVLDQLI